MTPIEESYLKALRNILSMTHETVAMGKEATLLDDTLDDTRHFFFLWAPLLLTITGNCLFYFAFFVALNYINLHISPAPDDE